MSKNDRNKLFSHPAVQLLEKALIKEWRQQLIASIGLFLLGLAMVYYLFEKNTLLTILGCLFIVLGLRFIVLKLRSRKPAHHPLLHLLKNQPQQIVWIYAVVTQRMPFGFEFSHHGILYFKLLDGDEFTVSLPVKQLKLVSKTLNRLLPHASFGYNDDKAQWYQADPAMLLKSSDKNKED